MCADTKTKIFKEYLERLSQSFQSMDRILVVPVDLNSLMWKTIQHFNSIKPNVRASLVSPNFKHACRPLGCDAKPFLRCYSDFDEEFSLGYEEPQVIFVEQTLLDRGLSLPSQIAMRLSFPRGVFKSQVQFADFRSLIMRELVRHHYPACSLSFIGPGRHLSGGWGNKCAGSL